MHFSLGLSLPVMPKVRCFFLLFLLFLVFLFHFGPIHNVSVVGCKVLMLWGGGCFQCQFPFQPTWFCLSPLFLEIMLSYFWHSSSKAFCVLGEMFLSSNRAFLCTGASAGDFGKSSSFCMNGFSKNSLSFLDVFLLVSNSGGYLSPVVPWCRFPALLHHCSLFLRRPLHDPSGDVSVHGD